MPVIINGTTGITDVNGTAAAPALTGTDTDTGIFFPAANTLAFSTNGTEDARFDSAGNFGLGVTPSTSWASDPSATRAIQLNGGSIWSYSTTQFNLLQNAVWNGSNNLYVNTAAASAYRQISGVHSWYNAPSGTAGNAITFTQAMTLDASGNLGIGTTSPGTKLDVRGVIQGGDGTIKPVISYTGGAGEGVFGTLSNHPVAFYTNSTERARITSGGEVYIAGTTDQGAYNLQVNGTGVWGAGAYVNGSDARLKEEVQDLAPALDVIASLRPVTFRYKEDYSKDQNVQPGFIAQELQTAMAGQAYVDGVIQSGPQHLNVAYQSLIPLLTKAIQELKAEFDAYKATHP